MRILLTTLLFLALFSCEKEKEIVPEKKPIVASEKAKKTVQEPVEVRNGIVFRDAQGNLLSESEKDSIVENTSQLQALRRFDNDSNNTEYILFENYEDLRGFIPDNAIDNLIEEAKLMRSGGRGAVLNKRIIDEWKDKKLPKGALNMLDGSVKSFKDFEGSILVVNLWYINCGPCIAEMPYLNNVVNRYKDEDITFLALSFDSIPDITNFLERTDFIYEQGSIDRNFSASLSPVAPAHFIVDKNGIIRDILIGAPRNTPEIYNRLVSVIEKNKK
tara:strand:- start:11041 stop:11862 length:822 start_codon:yes stop_codon:yes gene_type:complete